MATDRINRFLAAGDYGRSPEADLYLARELESAVDEFVRARARGLACVEAAERIMDHLIPLGEQARTARDGAVVWFGVAEEAGRHIASILDLRRARCAESEGRHGSAAE